MFKPENAIVLLSHQASDQNLAFGSAFIIAQDSDYSYLLTCAHVIEQINKGSTDNQLKILAIDTPVEIVCCGASDAIDIALLKVAGLLDKPMFKHFVLGQSEDDIYVTGYSRFENRHLQRPLKGKLGKSTKITAEGKEVPFWDVHIVDDELSKLDAGYSGSPIYNQENQVLAIVSHKRSVGNIGHAFCISNLKTLYPEISQLIPEIDQFDENLRLRNVRTGLFQRMSEIINIYKILGKCFLNMERQGIDEDSEVILITCEAFISNEIDTQNFIVFCQSIETEASKQIQDKPNYSSLAQRLNQGEIALCIGMELATTLDPKLNSASELPQHISALTHFENIHTPALAEICEYAEIHTDCTRHRIITELVKLVTPPLNYTPKISLYELLTHLQQPFLVISCGFDTLLAQRLKTCGKRFASIVFNNNIESTEQRLFVSLSDQESRYCSDEELSALRLMEEGYSLIYHPRGYPDENQDTLLLSERDYLNATDLLNKRYPAYLHNKLKGRGLWFLGYHPESWETRLLAKVLQYQRRNNRDQPLVIQSQASSFAKFFWREIQCQHYNNISLSAFITNIEALLSV
jgi:hypothetical protein